MATTDAQTRTRYSRLAADGADQRPFEVGEWMAFCFRRPDDRTQTNCLNLCATMWTYYLHCEICVLNQNLTDSRSLYITSESGRVMFKHVDYARQNAPVPWLFLWTKLNNTQRTQMQMCLESLSGDDAKVFSSCRIFCFHCAGCCAAGETTTCSETTMEVIGRIWHLYPREVKFYSPDNVFAFVNSHRTELGIDERMTNRVPDMMLRVAGQMNIF